MNQRLRCKDEHHPAEYAYHVLRGAIEKYGKGVAELTDKELTHVCQQAEKTFDIESRVLASKEASDVVIPQDQVNSAMQELAGRYPDHAAFLDDIHNNGMTEDALHNALYRELMFDAVMNKVGSRGADISDLDVQLFYQLHKDRFDLPEIRHARHVLITVNPEYADNTRKVARQRITSIRKELLDGKETFAELALKHSECPTGLQGGVLGKIKKGMLYPELDKVLFNMQEGEISEVVESETGFHILLCEKIEQPKNVSLSEVHDRIKAILEQRRARNCQKAWLADLERGDK